MAYQIGLSGGGGRSIKDVIHETAMKLKRTAHSGGFRVKIIVDGDPIIIIGHNPTVHKYSVTLLERESYE